MVHPSRPVDAAQVLGRGARDPFLPLEGIKVIELGQNIAGPYAGEVLATLGADVVKVERKEGDDARGWGPPFHDGMALSFHTVNRNKRGITLDLRDAEDLRWLKEYLRTCDIFVENMRPGSLEELGLDARTLAALNPRLIYCSLGAFGHKGPMRFKPGYEPILQAFAGLFSVNGTEETGVRIGTQILDLGTGIWAALGCLAALLQRMQTGAGVVVNASLMETALFWLTVPFATFKYTGTLPERHRSGSPKVIVFQSFRTSDGEIIIAAANDRLFAKFVRALGRGELASDERYATNALRFQNKAELLPQLEAIMASRPTAEWVELMEAAGVPCSPINDLNDVVREEQTQAIGMIQRVPDADIDLIGFPLSFDGIRPAIRNRAPRLGEHNDAVKLATVNVPCTEEPEDDRIRTA